MPATLARARLLAAMAAQSLLDPTTLSRTVRRGPSCPPAPEDKDQIRLDGAEVLAAQGLVAPKAGLEVEEVCVEKRAGYLPLGLRARDIRTDIYFG